MLDRQLAALSEAKILVFILIVLSLALGFFIGREGGRAISSSENIIEDESLIPKTEEVIDEQLKKLNSEKKNKPIPQGSVDVNQRVSTVPSVATIEGKINLQNIKKYLDQQVDNQMRLDINSKLDPSDFELKMIPSGGGTIYDGGMRYFSVQVELTDDEGKPFLLDITDPLPLLKENDSK